MKKLIYLFCLLIVFGSCRKQNDSPDALNTNFNHKILDGYFVTAIAFDHLGNAWIGTFKQGLIKYGADGIVVYNSTNSIISATAVINEIAIDSKNNVWIGENVSIMPNVTIGENAIIGANSVVTKDIPPNSVAVGAPARFLKTLNNA